jgi:hypothetical protein
VDAITDALSDAMADAIGVGRGDAIGVAAPDDDVIVADDPIANFTPAATARSPMTPTIVTTAR